ncbi:putative hsp70 family protein [Eutypa lata UCREL1]|uniref:Putative hsp70 family protein n=1 Tax=Eutypa lata (strain UCR-EL1) TaxID=1287681 RepID=M7TA39_EUTLA|nr:putative hsp70 family protein [Eutypa lata UCREL1]
MQVALTSAMRRANFRGVGLETNSIENLFLVSEPEAAAACVLELEPTIKPDDTFVLLDAGGGTVDANTYTVNQTMPLRLSSEVVLPGGGLCGSSYLNEAFKVLLKDKLKDEKYLELGEVTLDGIVEHIVLSQFEEGQKRHFNIDTPGKLRLPLRFICGGLRDNEEKNFRGSEKVVLIGGFAGSPSLHYELTRRVEQSSRKHKHPIKLIRKDNW